MATSPQTCTLAHKHACTHAHAHACMHTHKHSTLTPQASAGAVHFCSEALSGSVHSAHKDGVASCSAHSPGWLRAGTWTRDHSYHTCKQLT